MHVMYHALALLVVFGLSLVNGATSICSSCVATVTEIVNSTTTVPAHVTIYDSDLSTSIDFASYWSSLHAVNSTSSAICTTCVDLTNGTYVNTSAVVATDHQTIPTVLAVSIAVPQVTELPLETNLPLNTSLPVLSSSVTHITTVTSTITLFSTTDTVDSISTGSVNATQGHLAILYGSIYPTLDVIPLITQGPVNATNNTTTVSASDVVIAANTTVYNASTQSLQTTTTISTIITSPPHTVKPSHPLLRPSSSALSSTTSGTGSDLQPPRIFFYLSTLLANFIKPAKAVSVSRSSFITSHTVATCPAHYSCVYTTADSTTTVTASPFTVTDLSSTATASRPLITHLTANQIQLAMCIAPACLTSSASRVSHSWFMVFLSNLIRLAQGRFNVTVTETITIVQVNGTSLFVASASAPTAAMINHNGTNGTNGTYVKGTPRLPTTTPLASSNLQTRLALSSLACLVLLVVAVVVL